MKGNVIFLRGTCFSTIPISDGILLSLLFVNIFPRPILTVEGYLCWYFFLTLDIFNTGDKREKNHKKILYHRIFYEHIWQNTIFIHFHAFWKIYYLDHGVKFFCNTSALQNSTEPKTKNRHCNYLDLFLAFHKFSRIQYTQQNNIHWNKATVPTSKIFLIQIK